MKSLNEYHEEVSRHMRELYGISWADACGDTEPLVQARMSGQDPLEFVLWYAKKYGLTPLGEE